MIPTKPMAAAIKLLTLAGFAVVIHPMAVADEKTGNPATPTTLDLADKRVQVARAEVKIAEARLAETKKIAAAYQVQFDRWDAEIKRLKALVERGVVDPLLVPEGGCAKTQWRSCLAARDQAKAGVQKAEAGLVCKKALLEKAEAEQKVEQLDQTSKPAKRALVDVAEKVAKVARAEVKIAEAGLAEAKGTAVQAQAQIDRWTAEVKRLKAEVKRGVVDPQVLLESENQLNSSITALELAKAGVLKAEAEILAKKAMVEKAEAELNVAEQSVGVRVPSRFEGVIEQVGVKEGQKVKKGDVLGKLDDRAAATEVKIAEAKIVAAEAEHQTAVAAAKQAHSIWKATERMQKNRQAATPEELDKAKMSYGRASSDETSRASAVKVAKLELERARLFLDQHTIRSPRDGVVQKIEKKPGEAVHKLETVFVVRATEEK